jgi:hypothetical protein
MQMQGTVDEQNLRRQAGVWKTIRGFFLLPVVLAAVCVAIPYSIVLRWLRPRAEGRFRARMKEQGRLISWQQFVRTMYGSTGTCLEEKFSPKGPVRFWWTPEDVVRESPYEIIDWFTMRKGRQHEPFVHWCRQRYTGAETGSAVLVDTTLVPRREIYTLWSKCRFDASAARWIEVAPPEILPRRPGQ